MSILIHSGLGKTATTSLQEIAFQNSSSHYFIGKSSSSMKNAASLGKELLMIESSEGNITDKSLLQTFFTLTHLLVAAVSSGKINDENTSYIREKIKNLNNIFIKRNFPDKNFLFSHERMSFVNHHYFPASKTSCDYAISLHNEIFFGFGEALFLNTTRNLENYFASLYFQFMSKRISQGLPIQHPKSYFRSQSELHRTTPKFSAIWAYKTWSSSKIFSRYINIPERKVKIVSYEEIASKTSITNLLAEKYSIRFTQNQTKNVDNAFKNITHKETSRDKSEIIEQISSKQNIAKENVLPYVRELAGEYLDS